MAIGAFITEAACVAEAEVLGETLSNLERKKTTAAAISTHFKSPSICLFIDYEYIVYKLHQMLSEKVWCNKIVQSLKIKVQNFVKPV